MLDVQGMDHWSIGPAQTRHRERRALARQEAEKAPDEANIASDVTEEATSTTT